MAEKKTWPVRAGPDCIAVGCKNQTNNLVVFQEAVMHRHKKTLTCQCQGIQIVCIDRRDQSDYRAKPGLMQDHRGVHGK